MPDDVALEVPPGAAAVLQGNFVSPTDGAPSGALPGVIPAIPASTGSSIDAAADAGLQLRPVVEQIADQGARPDEVAGYLLLPAADGATWFVLGASVLDQPDLSSAVAHDNGFDNGWEILIELNEADQAMFATYTAEHIGQQLAIVVDGSVLSAPVITSPILGGEVSIGGSFTEAEAKELAALLAGG